MTVSIKNLYLMDIAGCIDRTSGLIAGLKLACKAAELPVPVSNGLLAIVDSARAELEEARNLIDEVSNKL